MSECADSTILIASNSLYEPLTAPVAADLTARGYQVVTYEADSVASGRKQLAVTVGSKGMVAHYDNQPLGLHTLASAWYWRPSVDYIRQDEDPASRFCLDRERRMLQDGLWAAVPTRAWLNPPEKIRSAENKLAQLALARELGFAVPETVVSNSWDDITALPAPSVVMKMAYGELVSATERRALYTKPFPNTGSALAEGNPYPAIWQPFLSKAREWRITAVGDQTFDTAIYTDEYAKDDWRRHQSSSGVVFRREAFPTDMREKCLQYLGRLGLLYGAFDFIEGPEGDLTFLECNPNGQYGWIESRLDMPISKAIASQLATIAASA